MSMMFFLPNMLLSGFVFPFLGMPLWAQWIGEWLPLTHYIRIVRAIMLKGSTLADLHYDTLALAGLMLIAMTHRGDALPPHARLSAFSAASSTGPTCRRRCCGGRCRWPSRGRPTIRTGRSASR